MKAEVFVRVVTTMPVMNDFRDEEIPAGTPGIVVEAYQQPSEGYAVDLEFDAPHLVGGLQYTNVILRPEQFRLEEETNRPVE